MTTTSLDRLKGNLGLAYTSTFFSTMTEEFDDDIKKSVMKNEEIFIVEFKKSSISLLQQCKALYEISTALKKDAMFMSWCKHVQLTKDKASELLKRHELYQCFPNNHFWVSSLSISAVKLLTQKGLDINLLGELAELDLKGVEEIKQFLITAFTMSNNPVEEIALEPTNEKELGLISSDIVWNDFAEIKTRIQEIKLSKDIVAYKSQVASLKKELDDLYKLIREKEKSYTAL